MVFVKNMSNLHKMTMVVARYNENLDWLKSVPWDYVVFNKSKEGLPEWIKNKIKLPNIGREAHSYLTYIIDNYDNLPEYIIFVQGNPFDHSKKLLEKIDRFDGKHDFFNLSDKILRDDGFGVPHHPGLKIAESIQKIFTDEIKYLTFSRGAQFIVSEKAILFHSKLTYQKIMDFMIDEKNCKQDREADLPFSAWIMERLWKTLFDSKHKTIYD